VEIHPFGRQIPDGGYPKTFIPAFSSTVVISGTSLQTGTFTNANSLYAHCQVQATSVQADGLWTQHFASTSPSSEVGTFSLSISSVGSITATDAGPQWRGSHGQLSATLPASPYTPDAGAVTVNVTF
jgi:hypothetical protein